MLTRVIGAVARGRTGIGGIGGFSFEATEAARVLSGRGDGLAGDGEASTVSSVASRTTCPALVER
jgi:hypothetical protein